MKRLSVALLTVAAGLTVTAATANAYTANPGHNIRYIMCATSTVDIDITNAYGDPYGLNNRKFTKPATNNPAFKCGNYQFTARETYGQFASIDLTAKNGGSVYCAIYDNGVKVSESRDDSEYYASAICG